MKKRLEVTLSVDAKTGEVTAVRNSFDKLDRKVGKTNKTLYDMKGRFLAIISVTAGIYGLIKAFSFLVESGYDYNKSMDDSTAKLTAMISASKGYVTVSGEQVTAQQRQTLIAAETAQMMDILEVTNAQTAMGMSELIDIYALAKPGMDQYKWSVQDQIEIVKLASNTASTFGMTSEELSSGIDDLAAGTWVASSGFGKMMKSIKVSKKEYQAAGDKIAYLKEKMKETGEAQDTMSVATSNFKVEWDRMAGQVTQPIFDGVKEALKHITSQMKTYGPNAMQVFSDALVSMVNGAISAVGTLISWVSKLVSGFRIAYAGYTKLAGAARAWWNNDNVENNAKIQALQKEEDRLKSLGLNYNLVRRQRLAVQKDMKGYEAGVKMWEAADKDLEAIAAFDEKMQGIASTVKAIDIKKGSIKDPIQEAIKPTDQLAYKLNSLSMAGDKNTKSLKAQAAAQKKLNREYLSLTGNKEGLFQLDVDETMQEFIDSGKYSAEQLSDIYDGMWDDYQDKAKESAFNVHTWLKDAFDIESDSVFGKLFDNLESLFDGLVGVLNSGIGINGGLAELDLGVQAADMLQQSGNPYAVAAGYAMEAIGAVFSNALSEAEIAAATGRSEFNSESLTNMRTALEDAQAPMLVETRSMLRHLESMDQKFGSIANAISSSTNGLDLDGSDFQSTADYGFLGFSSSQTELLGAGIEFGQQTVAGFLEGVDAIGYEAIKTTSSSFWGLVKSEKITEVAKDLPDGLKDDISKAFGESISAVMGAVEILGFDTTAIQAKLDQYVLDLGKLNFKDLSAEEQSQALSNAMSEQLDNAFNQAIGSIASVENIQALNDMARAGESYTETLVRAAIQHETVSTQLSLFGQTVTDFATSDALINAAGGLDAFRNAMSIFTQNFFSEEEQKAMQKQQLEMALMVHNISLPASKAQFRALVLETQQKIISVKTNIETMKAGIRADIAANNYKKMADESYARSAISTANNINQAAVLIGTSAHDMIEAAKGASVTAQSIDYTDAYSADIGLQALETELSNLEGIYGSLMQNMGAFADYYGGVESASQDKLNDTRQAQIDLINKEIELRNKLNSAIASMQESVYNSFEQLLGKEVPQLLNGLSTAINNKDYEGVSSAFNDYTTGLGNTAGSREEFLRGVIGANAMVQSIQGQEEMSLLEASLATEANTAETAYLARIALGLQEDTEISTERDNKLDREIALLEELIALQKIANATGATGLEIQEQMERDQEAIDIRSRTAS